MKRVLLYIAITIITISCTKSEILENTSAGGDINFSAGVVTTRVNLTNDLEWELGDKIGIFTNQTGEENLLFTIYNTSTGAMSNGSGTLLRTLDDGTRTYCVYYPYSSAQDEKDDPTIIDIDCTDQESIKPLLWATATSNSIAVSLKFSHKYAKVSFSLTAGGVEVSDLTDATAWLTGVNSKGMFNITTGTFTFSDDDIVNINLTIDKSNNTISDLYLPPSSGVKLWINDGDNTFVKSLDEWESGKEYVHDIMVGEVDIELEDEGE